MELFEAAGKEFRRGVAPLADRIRPRDLSEFVGQAHLLGPGCVLRQAVEAVAPGGRGHLKLYGKLGMSWVRFQLRFTSVPREPAISRLSPSNALWTPEPHSASFQPPFWPALE
jgi:hypothetical protein